MIAAALVGFAVLVALAGPRWLSQAPWVTRMPRLGIMAWQGLSVSVLLAALAAGLVLAFPRLPDSATDGIAGFLGACAFALREHYETAAGSLGVLGGLMVAGIVAGRTAWCLARQVWLTARDRRSHRERVDLVARPHVGRHAAHADVLVVEDGRPAAYCIPGRRSGVVLTSETLRRLDERQLDAVLAHERAHLRGRHHLAVLSAMALYRAFPFVPLFRHAAVRVPELLEMHADDHALRVGTRAELASAVVAMTGPGTGGATAGMSALGAPATLARVTRLAVDNGPGGRGWERLALGWVAVALVVPILLAAAPAVETSLRECCTVRLHS